MKKFVKVLIAGSIFISSAGNSAFVYAADENCGDFYEQINFALKGSASASKAPIPYWGPDKLIDGIVNRNDAKPDQSRWSSEAGAPAWIKVDLKEAKKFNSFLLAFENEKVQQFHIEVSDDDQTYSNIFTSESKASGQAMDTTVTLDGEVTARYVKVTVDSLVAGAYPSVSMYEFSVFGSGDKFYQNFAVDAVVSGSAGEAASVKIENSNDGKFATRWGSDTTHGEKSLVYTFEQPKTVKSLILEWERCNATGYKIEAEVDGQWQTLRRLGVPKNFTDKINLKEAVTTSKVRIVIDDFVNSAPNREGKDVNYPSVSLHEVQMYDIDLDVPPLSVADIAADVRVEAVGVDDTAVKMPTVPEGYTIKYLGADYEQILNRELQITKPLTTQDVAVNFEVTQEATGKKANTPDIKVSIPGLYNIEESVNEKPTVLPELQQWFGHEGDFAITKTSKIVVDPAASIFMDAANKFAADYKDILKKDIAVVSGTDPQPGDFYFTMSSVALDKETYVMDINDYVRIEASEEKGAYWSTRTILQILKQTQSTIHKGLVKDYPKYQVRSMMLDVSRKSFSLDFLKEIVKTFSWYKMSDFHIHLNDNCFTMIDDNGKKTPEYSGFRLESDKPNLTNEDVFYTKEEFNEFMVESEKLGVSITPEFDTPGHSGAFTRARPDIARGNEMEYLDVENPATVEFVKSVFEEYTSGADPVYPKGTIVHIGTDEYKRGNKEAFRKYQDDLLKFMRDEQGYTPRVWGSQTENSGTTPITVDGVQMNLWYTGYANPRTMYELGYDVINTNDGDLYIVPGAGYYHDYLNQSHIYSTWQPNVVGGFNIPAGSKQMLGSTFAVWNDMTGPTKDIGITDQEVFDRIYAILPTFSAKLWGDINDYSVNDINTLNKKVNFAPNSNPTYQVDSVGNQILDYNFNNNKGLDLSGNDYHLVEQKNVSYEKGIHRNALTLKGNESYVKTPVQNLGINSNLDFWVNRDSASGDEEQILFESAIGAIKAVQKETGKLGFSRDINDYSFNYELPKDEWVHIQIETQFTRTVLYVNGEKVDTLARDATGKKWATLIMPLERIGSTTKSFIGQIDDVSVYKKATSNMLATATSEEPSDKASNAVDGNPSTIWHTKWDGTDKLPQSITLELPKATDVKGFSYLPRQSGTNGNITKYKIEVSLDGENFTQVATDVWANDSSLKQADFDLVQATYVRLTASQGVGGYASAAEVNVITKDGIDTRALKEAIADAKDLVDSTIYTPDSIALLQLVIEEAQLVLDTGLSQEQMDEAREKVDAAINALVKLSNKEKLLAVIEEAKAIDADRYTEETKAELLAALDNAKAVNENLNASQEVVDHAVERLEAAIKNLEIIDTALAKSILKSAIDKAVAAEASKEFKTLAPSVQALIISTHKIAQGVYDDENATNKECMDAWLSLANALHFLDFQADKELLEGLIKECKEINTDDYKAGVEAFKAALAEAETVFKNENALQASINAAYDSLVEAKAGLVKNDAVNKSLLEILINSIDEKVGDGKNYKQDENWAAFDAARAAAKAMIAKADATQVEVNDAMFALAQSYENIRLLPSEEQLETLKGFVNVVKKLNRNLFTKEQLANIDSINGKAEAMITDFDEKQYAALENDITVVLKMINNTEGSLLPVEDGSAKAATPNTGDYTNMATILFMLLLSGCGIALIRRRRIEKASK